MKEQECRFTSIITVWCNKCKEDVVHECGKNLKTDEKVKLCLGCDTITVLKK